MADQDTELTLGTGRILGLFFGLVVLCGVFFVVGFSLGKNSAPMSTQLTDTSVPAVVASGTAAKPSATQGGAAPKPADCGSTPEGCTPTVPNGAAQTATPAPVQNTSPVAVEQKPAAPAPEVSRPAALSTGYIVQVAAVSRQEDAEALASALRKKQYAVFISNQTSDNLFHVQVGPFSDPKDAESVRSRLISDGYNPILKR